MNTVAASATWRHTAISIDTQYPTQFIDLTDRIETLVTGAGLQTGLVNIQTLHTTTGVVVNEHEPLLLMDVVAMFERLAPRDAEYSHDNITLRTVNCILGERPNGHSHCRALLLPTTICLNVVDGRLQLGRWQRVFLVELDGPRMRDLSVVLMGEGES